MKMRLEGTENELRSGLSLLRDRFDVVSESKFYDGRYNRIEKQQYLEVKEKEYGYCIIYSGEGSEYLPLKDNRSGMELRFESVEAARSFVERNVPELEEWEIRQVKGHNNDNGF